MNNNNNNNNNSRKISNPIGGYFKEHHYGLLDQNDVVEKYKYICHKECDCDEKKVNESLEKIRAMFHHPHKKNDVMPYERGNHHILN